MNKALVQLTVTRVREIFRHPEAIFWTFLFPVRMSVVLGVAFRSERPDPSAAIVVEGQGADLLEAALRGDAAVRVERMDAVAANARLRAGRAAILLIPGDPVTFRFDPTRPESEVARVRVNAAVQRAAGSDPPHACVGVPSTARWRQRLSPGGSALRLPG